jgi:hypothetical protein
VSTCIYCDSNTQLSQEHVFPAAFGCPWVLQHAVCRKCNNQFNSEFEGSFIKSTGSLRTLLGIKDRYGNTPDVRGTAKIHGVDHPIRVSSEGMLSIPTMKIPMNRTEDGQPFKIVTFTAKQNQQVAKGLARKSSKLKNVITEETKINGEAVVPLDFTFLTGNAALRSVAKIAYTGLAFVAGSAFAKSDTFASVREHLLSGTGKISTRLFHNKIIALRTALERDQFTLVIACDGRKGCAHAAVFFFGTLSYLVTLHGGVYRGPDVLKTIGFNGYTRSDCQTVCSSILAEYELIAEVNSSKTIWNSSAASGGYFMNFLRSTGLDIRPLKTT